MGVYEFLLLLIVAAIIGSIGQAIAGYSTPGCAMSIVIGFVGALLGHFIQRMFGLPALWILHVAGERIEVIWAVIGAAICVLILRLFLGRRVVAD